MTELKCDYDDCYKKAKYKCDTCGGKAIVCSNHVMKHKDEIGHGHEFSIIEESKEQHFAPQSPSSRPPPEEPKKPEHSGAPLSSGEEDTDVIEDESEEHLKIMSVVSSAERDPRPIPVAADGLALIFRLFESTTDVARNFLLHKWGICIDQASDFLRRMTASSELKVVGAYGGLRESLAFASQVLKIEVNYEQEGHFQGILGFANPETSTVCLVFQIKDESVYLTKPYPEKSNESVLIRLLIDLCPVIVCCPSDEIIREWYWNENPSKMNPFVPRPHQGADIIMTQEKRISTELSEMQVINQLDLPSFTMTPDGHHQLFQWSIKQAQREDLPGNVITALAKANNSIKKILDEFNRVSRNRPPRLQDPPFDVVKKSLKLPNLGQIEKKVIEAYNKMLLTLGEHYKTFAETLWEEIMDNFNMNLRVSGWLGLASQSIDSVRDEILKNLEDCWIQDRGDRYINQLTPFVVNAKTGAKYDSLLMLFNANMEKFRKKKAEWIAELANKFKNEFKEICLKEYQALESYELTFATCELLVSDSAITLKPTTVKNRIPGAVTAQNLSFYIMDKEVAFAVFVERDQLQVWKFNPKTGLRSDLDQIPEIHSIPLIATGSHPKQFVAFYNEEKKVVFGALQDLKRINKGTFLTVYGDKVTKVISACILSNATRKIFMINERGLLYVIDLANSKKTMQPVYAPKRKDEPNIPFKPQYALDSLILKDQMMRLYISCYVSKQ